MKLDRFRDPTEVPLVPLAAMIDVLFLMIIFLVLGANFDPTASVELPEATGSEVPQGVARVELRSDGSLWLEGKKLSTPQATPTQQAEALQAVRALAPRAVLLMPDGALDVKTLFRWYEILQTGLKVPVSVGVQPPAP